MTPSFQRKCFVMRKNHRKQALIFLFFFFGLFPLFPVNVFLEVDEGPNKKKGGSKKGTEWWAIIIVSLPCSKLQQSVAASYIISSVWIFMPL